MKRKLFFVLSFCFIFCMGFFVTGCSTNGLDGKSAYQIWLDNGYTGTQADFLNWLQGSNGIDGEDGKEVEFQIADGYIQWKYKTDDNTESWQNLITLSDLKGADGEDGTSQYIWIVYSDEKPTNNYDLKSDPSNWMGIYAGTSSTKPENCSDYTWYKIKGTNGLDGKSAYQIWLDNGYTGTQADFLNWLKGANGTDGEAGKEVEFQIADGYIQWRYKTDNNTESWQNLITLSDLKGADGEDGTSQYVWIVYSDGMPTSNYDLKNSPSNWMGIYAGTSSTKPENYRDYTWYKIKGENGQDATYETYTVNYDYGDASFMFSGVKQSETIRSTQWLTNMPTIKTEYKDLFNGWFIEGTNKQVFDYDFIGGNVTLVAKFDVNLSSPAGLYQNGKMAKSWSTLVEDYPSAFPSTGVIKGASYNSYLKSLSGDFVIDSSIETIDERAFYGCDKLTSILIPNGVTTIQTDAFFNCKSLTSITIPKSVTSIAGQVFSSCSGLESIVVEEGNPNYSSSGNCLIKSDGTLLSGCKNSVIPTDDSVARIGLSAFYDCLGLTSIIIPNSVTTIQTFSFQGCRNLKTIVIPKEVTFVNENAFANCSSLTDVYYTGSANNWNSISFGPGNTQVTQTATIHYYSETQPTEADYWWHYNENNEIVNWEINN